MFAVGIKGLDLTSSTGRKVTVSLSSNTYENFAPIPQVEILELGPCD